MAVAMEAVVAVKVGCTEAWRARMAVATVAVGLAVGSKAALEAEMADSWVVMMEEVREEPREKEEAVMAVGVMAVA